MIIKTSPETPGFNPAAAPTPGPEAQPNAYVPTAGDEMLGGFADVGPDVIAANAAYTAEANAAAGYTAAETNAEQAGRMARAAKVLGNVAMNHVAPALSRAFGRAGRNLRDLARGGAKMGGTFLGKAAETVGNMAEAGARGVGRVARGIGSVAYGGYARLQTTLGIIQSGAGTMGNTSGNRSGNARRGLGESLGRSLRTTGAVGAVAIGTAIGLRHGMHFGGHGGHVATEALPSLGGGSHGGGVSFDSLPDTGHVDFSPEATSALGSNKAGNTLGHVLEGGAIAGAGVGAIAVYRGHRRKVRANRHWDHNRRDIHNFAQQSTAAGVQAFHEVLDTKRTGQLRDINTINGAADELITGAPVFEHPYHRGAGSSPRGARRADPLPYDSGHTRGGNILRRGRRHNKDYPIGH